MKLNNFIYLHGGDAYNPHDEEALLKDVEIDTIVFDAPYTARDYKETTAFFRQVFGIAERLQPERVIFWGNWAVYPVQFLTALQGDYLLSHQFLWGGDWREGSPDEFKCELIGCYSKVADGYCQTRFIGGRYKDVERRFHPEEKPVPVIEEVLRGVGAKIVYDPFAGSGATLKACETLGIKGYGMEVDPGHFANLHARLTE